MPDDNHLNEHFRTVTKAIADGELVPFLGAGANLCGRPEGVQWQPGEYLPDSAELAAYLSKRFDYPQTGTLDTLHVSQYASVMRGIGPLYEKLHRVFNQNYSPTPVQYSLAALPGALSGKGCDNPYQLIVTTNYDDLLERAFKVVDEPFDLVYYEADGANRGKFWHLPHSGEKRLIANPNEYTDLPIDERQTLKRSVILKIHGSVDRNSIQDSSFVITEDHYIDYLARVDRSNPMPVKLTAKLRRSHFLFLGYSLRDWNLRVFLHRIWGEEKLRFNSWAIQLNPDELDQRFWIKRDVEILNMPLDHYIEKLNEFVRDLSSVRVPHE